MMKLTAIAAIIAASAGIAGCCSLCKCDCKAEKKYFKDDPVPVAPTQKISLFNGKNYDGWDLFMRKDKFADSAEEVFTVKDGAMHVTGKGFGGVTTKQAYKDYHLKMQFRYVGEGYASRKNNTADGGLLFHCIGPEGSFGGIWRLSFECNIIQGRTGDLIVVGNMRDYPTLLRAKAFVDKNGRWEPRPTEKTAVKSLVGCGRVDNLMYDGTWKDVASQPVVPPERPYGEWNDLELICDGDTAEYILNGKTVLKLFDLAPAGGCIQLQSECHGIEYRNITIEPVAKR
jgi:hypothetical protein